MFNLNNIYGIAHKLFKINKKDFEYLLDLKFNIKLINSNINILNLIKLFYYLLNYHFCKNIYHTVKLKYFYNSMLTVNKHVLIPRFETELLVDLLLKELDGNATIIDLGTGSGAIAIALKKEFPTTKVYGIDVSKKVIKIAKKNAQLNNVNINFENTGINNVAGKYSVIVSNPPYIAMDEVVDENVFLTEPHLALFAEDKGLYFYKLIIKKSLDILTKPGIIAFEIGCEQATDIKKIITATYPTAKIDIYKDLNNLDRIIIAKIKN